MRLRYWILLGVLAALAVAGYAQATKRLILKDGSYQVATKWEVKGDRVRFFSAERADWEEMPESLVDWKATEAYEKDASAGKNADLERAIREDEEDAEREAAANPLVAPGVRLPDGGGVFLLESYKGQPQLDELVQTNGEINKQTGKNILRATINPLASSKQSIELKGPRARVQSHTGTPEIYIDIDSDTQTQKLELSDHFKIAKLTPKKDNRLLGNLKISMIGNVSQQGNFIQVKAEKLPGDWIKITPVTPLPPGEYAVVEMLTAKEMNLYVWDFGVDPDAPENPTAWKPVAPRVNKMGTDASPILVPHQ